VTLEPADECWATVDPGKVAQVVRVLIDNALRFSSPGAPVTVEVTRDADHAAVCVTDEGPGVAVDERERIFERFSRGREPGGDQGFGLGLAIGRELARRMDGELTVEDGRPGARFRLVVPAAEVRQHAHAT
jgi:signal transduction histidine kinase